MTRSQAICEGVGMLFRAAFEGVVLGALLAAFLIFAGPSILLGLLMVFALALRMLGLA